MARREITILTDDLTGEESDDIQTVPIIANGVAYECDMSGPTREAYAEAIQPYLSVARRVGRAAGNNVLSMTRRPVSAVPAQGRRMPGGHADRRDQNQAIREWANRNAERLGVVGPLAERGRIPGEIVEAFQKYAGRDIPAPEPVAPPEPVVKPSQTKRAPRTVGAEVRVNSPSFSHAEEPPTPRKRVAAATAKVPAKVPAKATRKRAATG